MEKELVPIILSCAVWGPLLSGSKVEFKHDNSSIVDLITKGSSKKSCIISHNGHASFAMPLVLLSSF